MEEEPVTQKRIHKEITPSSFQNDLQELFVLLNTEIDKQQKKMVPSPGIRALKSARMRVVKLQKHFPKVAKRPRTKRVNAGISSGIMKPNPITEELAKFLGVPLDTKLSRVEIQGALAVYCRVKDKNKKSYVRWGYLNPEGERNLQDPKDRKFIIPDKKLSKLLRYDQYKKKIADGKIIIRNKKTGESRVVTDDRLQYFTITSLIGQLIKK